MAKSNAQLCRESRQRRNQKKEALDQKDLVLPFPAGTRNALAQLMEWHSHDDQREAIATMIHRLHEAGREASAPFFAVSRHEITITEKLSRQLKEFAASRSTEE